MFPIRSNAINFFSILANVTAIQTHTLLRTKFSLCETLTIAFNTFYLLACAAFVFFLGGGLEAILKGFRDRLFVFRVTIRVDEL